MRKFRNFCVAALASLGLMASVAPAQADAYLHLENAKAHCASQTSTAANGWPGLSGYPKGYSLTAYHRYASNDLAVRIQWRRFDGFPHVVYYNCRIQGQDYDWYVNPVSFFLAWAAPNYVVDISAFPAWRIDPFADPVTGVAW